LLSLGLASKVLGSIIFPRHIQYHTVRASLRDFRTWQHLIHNRSCARNVRCLEVIPGDLQGMLTLGLNHFELRDSLDCGLLNGISRGTFSNVAELE